VGFVVAAAFGLRFRDLETGYWLFVVVLCCCMLLAYAFMLLCLKWEMGNGKCPRGRDVEEARKERWPGQGLEMGRRLLWLGLVGCNVGMERVVVEAVKKRGHVCNLSD